MPEVPNPIAVQLWSPEFQSTFGHAGEPASRIRMLVPETATNGDGEAPGWENDVRRTGQLPIVQSVPEPSCVKETANGELGFCVLAPDPSHLRGT